jgi:hypothetical protein
VGKGIIVSAKVRCLNARYSQMNLLTRQLEGYNSNISTPRLTSRKTSGGVIFFITEKLLMAEPSKKRVIAFFDGQNLFYAVKKAFGYSFSNYDPLALARRIC